MTPYTMKLAVREENLPTFVCHKNGAASRIFTDGKRYTSVAKEGAGFLIRDDIGALRFVCANECDRNGSRSPHLMSSAGDRPYWPTHALGWFARLVWIVDEGVPYADLMEEVEAVQARARMEAIIDAGRREALEATGVCATCESALVGGACDRCDHREVGGEG